jgi:hypothetical protein
MNLESVKIQETKFLSWVKRYQITEVIEASPEALAELIDQNQHLYFTEFDDLSGGYHLCQGIWLDLDSRLPVLGWYKGAVEWEGEIMEFIDVYTSVSLDCTKCEGSGETKNGRECKQCEGDGAGELIEFNFLEGQ